MRHEISTVGIKTIFVHYSELFNMTNEDCGMQDGIVAQACLWQFIFAYIELKQLIVELIWLENQKSG